MKPPPIKRRRANPQPSAPAVHVPLSEGFLVADKYGLIEPIGTGSMGTVWKATHVMLGHMVAIKFLHASVEAYPEGRLRFEREAKLSARLGETSRHICRVQDYGVIASTPFVVMELLQGEELSARLKRERQLPLPLVTEIVVQLCRALTVAHDAGVIHRDLKPANVYLCKPEDDQEVFVKLLDFGVAKAALEHEDTQGTRAGTIFGTPGYMSPEQIVAETELDARSDLWSLAVIAYRMAVGRTPFSSGGLGELGLRILTTNPPLPSTVRPDLPKRFDEWMRRGLAKQREYRFSSANELSSALVEAVGARDSEVAPSDPTLAEGPSSEESPTYEPIFRSAPTQPVPERSRVRRFFPLLLTGVALTAAAGVFASGVLRKRSSAAEHVPPAESVTSASSEPLPATSRETPSASAEAAPPSASAAPPSASSVPSGASPAEQAKREVTRPATSSVPRTSTAKSTSTRPARPPGSVAKRAGELWNKKDEL